MEEDSSPPDPSGPRVKITPLPDGQYLMDLDLDRDTYEKIRYLQALLGDSVPPGDLVAVIELALETYIRSVRRRRYLPRLGKRRASLRRPRRGLRRRRG